MHWLRFPRAWFLLRRLSVGMAFCLALMLGAQAARAEPIAVLSDVTGEVQVVHGGNTLKGKSGTTLEAGDLVRVVQGSATIFHATRAPQVIKTGAMLQLSATQTTTVTPSVWRNVMAGLSTGFTRRSRSVALGQHVGAGPNIPVPLVPVGPLLAARPTFVWQEIINLPGLDFQDYQITIFDQAGQVFWQGTGVEPFLVYPADAPALQDGQPYTWQVVARRLMPVPGQATKGVQPDPKMTSKAAPFAPASAETRTELAPQMRRLSRELVGQPGELRRVALAAFLNERGFASDALLRLQPDPSKLWVSITVPRPEFQSRALQSSSLDEASKVWAETIGAAMK